VEDPRIGIRPNQAHRTYSTPQSIVSVNHLNRRDASSHLTEPRDSGYGRVRSSKGGGHGPPNGPCFFGEARREATRRLTATTFGGGGGDSHARWLSQILFAYFSI
jgi:hypothetical protein